MCSVSNSSLIDVTIYFYWYIHDLIKWCTMHPHHLYLSRKSWNLRGEPLTRPSMLRFSTSRAHGNDVGLCYRDSSQCTSANGSGRALQWPLDAGNCGLLLVSPGYKISLIVWCSGTAMAWNGDNFVRIWLIWTRTISVCLKVHLPQQENTKKVIIPYFCLAQDGTCESEPTNVHASAIFMRIHTSPSLKGPQSDVKQSQKKRVWIFFCGNTFKADNAVFQVKSFKLCWAKVRNQSHISLKPRGPSYWPRRESLR